MVALIGMLEIWQTRYVCHCFLKIEILSFSTRLDPFRWIFRKLTCCLFVLNHFLTIRLSYFHQHDIRTTPDRPWETDLEMSNKSQRSMKTLVKNSFVASFLFDGQTTIGSAYSPFSSLLTNRGNTKFINVGLGATFCFASRCVHFQ